MKISELSEEIDKLPNKNAILKVIELKTENDMREVIFAINDLRNRLDRIETSLEKKSDKNLKIILWAIGILASLIGAGFIFFNQ